MSMPLSVSLHVDNPAATVNSDSGLQHSFFFSNEIRDVGCFQYVEKAGGGMTLLWEQFVCRCA